MSAQEWPKWVNSRIANSPEEVVALLSHTEDCAIHPMLIVRGERPGDVRFRARHPDHVLECDCGGITPDAEALALAGVSLPKEKKPLTSAQIAALDRIPGDGVLKAGGAPKGGNRRKKKTAK